MISKDQEGRRGIFKRSRSAQRPLRLFNADGTVLQRIRGTSKHTGFLVPGFRQEYGPLTGSSHRIQAALVLFGGKGYSFSPRKTNLWRTHVEEDAHAVMCTG